METIQSSRAVRVFDRPDPSDASATIEPFRRHVEPLIEELEAASWSDSSSEHVLAMRHYARAWREPARQRELSFVLEALLPVLGPGRRCLAVGLGLVPVAYALAGRAVWADLCDDDARQVRLFRRLRLDTLWDSWVDYSSEDLGRLSYPAATFDAVAWLSAPGSGETGRGSGALDEMLRILKPGGVLAVTLDRQAKPRTSPASRSGPVSAILRFGLGKSNVRGNW